MYLPTVTETWKKYIENSEAKCKELQAEIETKLNVAINEAMDIFRKGEHNDDPWLRHLDWTIKPTKMIAQKVSRKGVITPSRPFNNTNPVLEGLPKWIRGDSYCLCQIYGIPN